MTSKKDMEVWDTQLHKLANSFGEGDKEGWLMAYIDLKQTILDGCSLGRYANALSMSDSMIASFGGYEYLAILLAKLKVLDDAIKGLIEEGE